MHNYIKITVLLVVLIFSLTACKAAPQQEIANEEPLIENPLSDSLQIAGYEPGEWITDYQAALKASAELEKPILVNFTGSDWCIWCKRLSSEVFTQKEFIEYAKANLVLLKLDFPRSLPQPPLEKKQNEELAGKFKIGGFPTILVLDKDGTEIARTGYQQGGAASYVAHLKEIIRQPK